MSSPNQKKALPNMFLAGNSVLICSKLIPEIKMLFSCAYDGVEEKKVLLNII